MLQDAFRLSAFLGSILKLANKLHHIGKLMCLSNCHCLFFKIFQTHSVPLYLYLFHRACPPRHGLDDRLVIDVWGHILFRDISCVNKYLTIVVSGAPLPISNGRLVLYIPYRTIHNYTQLHIAIHNYTTKYMPDSKNVMVAARRTNPTAG